MKKSGVFRAGIWMYCTLKRNDLANLAQFFNTGKESSHAYSRHYQHHFAHLRHCRLNILEIGVGGHRNPEAGGASLRMWKYYFPRSNIFGIDLYEKHFVEERRIKVFTGDQGDPEFLTRVAGIIGNLHIVIDDGSHQCADVIASFTTLFPLMESGGIYAVEDTFTSYMPKFGGDPNNFNTPATTMGFLKNLADGLHRENRFRIASIHFYQNLVFIKKL